MPFEVVGHRGARGLFPENTIEGFRAAAGLGIRSFELDVGMTCDGVVVVHHDTALNPDVARLPDGAWLAGAAPLLKTLDYAELRRFDVGRIRPGSRYAAVHPAQQPIDGARIPRLVDVLALDDGLRITIEMKLPADHPKHAVPPDRMAEAVIAIVDAAAAADRVILSSFTWQALRDVHRRRPSLARSWLTGTATTGDAELWWGASIPYGASVPDIVEAQGGGTWSPEYSQLTETLVSEAHARHLRVVPWTVNHPADIARLLRWGVDGVITDRPDLARAVSASGHGA